MELEQENKRLHVELGRWQEENQKLKKELENIRFGDTFLKQGQSTDKTSFFTGFPRYEVFVWALSLCAGFLPTSKKLSPANVFLLILMKIRLVLLSQDLAHRFNISCSTVSKLLNAGLPVIAAKLSFLVRWPRKEEVQRTLPSVFKPSYKNCRVIIDCTEICCGRASNLTLRALTWSNYNTTIHRILTIFINPNGVGHSLEGLWAFFLKTFLNEALRMQFKHISGGFSCSNFCFFTFKH